MSSPPFEEQRDFLLRSLEDLDREHAAGDLDDDDHQELRDDYTVRAAEVLRAIDAERAAFEAAKRPRSLRRTAVTAGVVLVFAVVASLLAAQAMGARQPGESATGGINVRQSASQRATDCSSEINADPTGALECLDGILEEDPNNAVALTWSAWLLSLGADTLAPADRVQFQALAAVRLDRAVESDPNYSYARAFRAVVAMRNERFEDAQRYLEEFYANDPAAQAVQVIEDMGVADQIAAGLASAG